MSTRENFLDFGKAYETFVKTGVKLDPDTYRERVLLAATGVGGEAGEVIDHIKKLCFHGKPLDREEFILELGDLLWYYTLLLSATGVSYTEVMTRNIEKLVARYPEKHPNAESLLALAYKELHKLQRAGELHDDARDDNA